jgi:hypothetical protein
MKYSVIALSSTLLVIATSAHGGDAPPVPPNPAAGATAHGGDAPPVPPPANAGPDTLETLKKRIDALEKEVKKSNENAVTTDDVNGVNNTLQTFLYQYQRDRDTGQTTTALRQLQIGGVVYLRGDVESKPYNLGNGQATSIAPTPTTFSNNSPVVAGRRDTFDVYQATLFFQGNLYRDYGEGRNLTFRVAANSTPGVNPSGDNVSNTAPLSLTDAYLVYQFLPTLDPAGDTISATFGQQLLPFGLEAQADESLRPVIVSAQFAIQAGEVGQRETGLILRGSHDISFDYGYNYGSPLFTWALGLVNGGGINRADDNNYKDQVGRFEFKIPTDYNSWVREVRFGVSAYHGRQNLTGATPATAVVDSDTGPAPGTPVTVSVPSTTYYAGQGQKNRYGFDVYYNHNPFGFTFEYIVARDDALFNNNLTGGNPTFSHLVAPTSLATAQKYTRISNDYVATAYYQFGEQFLNNAKLQGRFDDWYPKTYQFFFRYDRYDNDLNIENDTTDIYTLGFNLWFAQTTKLQLNLIHKTYHDGGVQVANKATVTENEALLQFQYGF